jgi:hypothetical protein
MTREILFRGQPIGKGGIWMVGIGAYKTHTAEHLVLNAKGDCVEVVHLCQYTGLKDCNGKKIFEGDVVIIGEKLKAKVIYYDGAFRMQSEFSPTPIDTTDMGYMMREFSVRVIGNIHDNPELIKKSV